jgi:hypothetical protein
MIYTFERLLDGDSALLPHYRLARERWRSVWAAGVEDLADTVTRELPWFERNCGGGPRAVEAMVIAGFASLYSTRYGFDEHDDQAEGLALAFERSGLPEGIKRVARAVAGTYGVPTAPSG